MVFDAVSVGELQTNCYLIGDKTNGVCAVVDPGADPEEILDMVGKSGLRLEKILLTHGHFDHVGAVAALAAAFPGVEVLMHKDDFNTLDSRLFPLYWEIEKNTCPLEEVGFYPPAVPVRVGSLEVKVLHTPGHTAGSVVLLAEDVMLSGDTLFAGACGRCDLPGGDWWTMLDSLARLAKLEGNCKVCPGHGPLSTLDRERQCNPYMKQAMKR